MRDGATLGQTPANLACAFGEGNRLSLSGECTLLPLPKGECALLPPPLGEGWGGGFHGATSPKAQDHTPSVEGNRLSLFGESALLPLPLGEGWGEGFHSATSPKAQNHAPIASKQPPEGQGASQ